MVAVPHFHTGVFEKAEMVQVRCSGTAVIGPCYAGGKYPRLGLCIGMKRNGVMGLVQQVFKRSWSEGRTSPRA